MYRTFFVFLKCTIQGGPKVDLLLIAYLHLWLEFWEGIDKYWIVPVRKLFCFHHCVYRLNFANIILWQCRQIHRSISRLRRKCGFILQSPAYSSFQTNLKTSCGCDVTELTSRTRPWKSWKSLTTVELRIQQFCVKLFHLKFRSRLNIQTVLLRHSKLRV